MNKMGVEIEFPMRLLFDIGVVYRALDLLTFRRIYCHFQCLNWISFPTLNLRPTSYTMYVYNKQIWRIYVRNGIAAVHKLPT